MVKTRLHIIRIFTLLLLLLAGGTMNEAWAAKVTYHVLTLPFTTKKADGTNFQENIRVEAIRVIVDNGTQVELPAHFKSPLAENFTYYAADDVTQSVNPEDIYQYLTKAYTYTISDSATPLEEGSSITTDCHIYVIYTYKADNGIAKLDGSKIYNIAIGGGFLAYNRGRNNRPAIVPKKYVTAEELTSEEFVKVDLSDGKSGITTYWQSGDNKNTKADVESQFHFLFKYTGEDPYNITICSAYNQDNYFIEKNIDGGKFVNKYYKGSTLFARSTENMFLTSDGHIRYKTENPNKNVTDVEYDQKPGYFHGLTNPIWSSFVLLNSTKGDGYVFMGSRTVSDKGVFSDPTKSGGVYQYYYLTNENNNNASKNNNLTLKLKTTEVACTNYSADKEMYEIKDVNFKVKTPFGNYVTASVKMSKYSIENDDIATEDVPTSLDRKYCNFTGKFYKDAALTQEITSYSELTSEPYDVYVGYSVSGLPFAAITPAAEYSDATWKTATWYEMTDEGSTEENGKKIKYDGSAYFKNNGAHGEYEKTSEYAFIGDPYELRVVSRSLTSGASPSYVGAAGTPTTETALTANTSVTAGYQWQIPDDGTPDSDKNFKLQLFDGEGYWSWTTDHINEAYSYATKTHTLNLTSGNVQTVTLNISGLTYANGNYITVTAGGTDASQVTATVPTLSSGRGAVRSDGTATVTATIAANGGESKSFTLTIQEYNTSNAAIETATVVTINQAAAAYAGSAVEYSTTSSTRIKVLELPKCTYTYKIVDKAGNIAAKASVSQTIFSPLSVACIPSIIVSPFILDETITFYKTYGSTGRASLDGETTETPNENHDIFVKYTTTKLDNKPIKLSEDQEFNVKLNGRFLYCEKVGENVVIKTNASPSTDALKTKAYLWKLRGRDPYFMIIENMQARVELWGADHANDTEIPNPTIYDDDGTGTTSETRQVGAWVIINGDLPTTSDGTALAFDKARAHAQRFIAKSSINQGIYEVMVATDEVDASTTYYNIGCPADNTVKIYNNTTYEHGFPHLAFVLNQTKEYKYYLIDKAKHKLLEATSKTPDLALPAEYQSPLVATYNYYGEENITITGDEYTPTDASQKIDNLEAVYTKTSGDYSSQWAAADDNHRLNAIDEGDVDTQAKELKSTGHFYFKIGETSTYYDVNVTKPFHDEIYVTYEKNDLVNFDEGSPYMLRYLNPHAGGYHLEDGGDKLTEDPIEAVYPYCNGDGSLNIYGTAMNEEQMGGGASTRTRWVWYFESDNNDPYHVKIHSYNTISFNSVAHPTYLQTYAVHFNQDADPTTKHIVTCGILPGIASVEPTEYMILGSVGQYKLVTTNEVEGTRRTVNTFEQYWKTYDMIKKCVLEIEVKEDEDHSGAYKDEFSNNESTWVVPSELQSTLKTKLDEKGVGGDNWHSFEVIANGKRWNGYNDKGTGTGKVVEKLEHWFQTFEMGDGTFNIESAVIPPVLVLLDRHGWEIMRKPLPNPYSSDEGLDALRAYDSPLVKEYKFYSSATKATGCHKYTVLKKGVEQNQITVNGQHYTSTSLASLPPETATGVKDNKGAFNDQFVTYTVKDEYEKSYSYAYYEDSGAETETLSKFLVIQNHRFARDNSDTDTKDYYMSKPIRQGSAVPDDKGEVYDMIVTPTSLYADKEPQDGVIDNRNLWYVRPNLKIDEEMGIIWGTSNNVDDQEPLTEAGTKKRYKTYGMSGFDPYNIQLQNVMNGKYMSTHITKTSLSSGILVGDYSGVGGTNGLTFVDKFTDYTPGTSKGSEGYDHTNIQMSNQTFMAVSDANGNMQLMPRFDHTKRIDVDANAPYLTTLQDPVDHTKATVDNWRSMGRQTTFFVHPNVYEYHIIDHEGRESLRYKSGGESAPYIPDHFKSPLATDFKYYFNHAALTTTESSEASYNVASSTYFKKEVASDAEMETAAKALTVLDDYYFRIGAGTEESPYTYRKVTVTKGYVAGPTATDATYTTTNSSETEWTNAEAHQQSSTDEADFISDSKALATEGTHYFQIGPTTLYRKVTVDGTTKTTEDSNSTDWSSHEGGTQVTAADLAAFKTAVNALSSDGTYYYKITSYYSYKKVVVASINSDFGSDVAAKKDVSSKEITGTFAEAGLTDLINQVYVRYSYWGEADNDHDKILQGKWFTIQLDGKNVKCGDTNEINPSDGNGVSLLQGTPKPATVDGTDANRIWQWKFLASPVDPESEFYGSSVDPYAVQIFNRKANYTTDMNLNPNPMGTGVKVDGTDRFALLSHPNGGYAFAAAGVGLGTYTYSFLNGADMTTSVGAKIVAESSVETDANHFTFKSNALSDASELVLNDDVTHTYTYKVITNNDSGNKLAVSDTQTGAVAAEHNYAPYLPEDIQTPLLKTSDYEYYGGADINQNGTPADDSDDTYAVIDNTKLITLLGLYNDEVFVRYKEYDVNNTYYKVPNKRNATGGRAPGSKDAALSIDGSLPYNIIWEGDKMMQTTDGDNITSAGSHALDGAAQYVWRFYGKDPYAIQIRHNTVGKYVDGDDVLSATADKTYMLLKKEGYDYGILQETSGTNRLTGFGGASIAEAPSKFTIFALSVHNLIYRLIIANTCTKEKEANPDEGQYADIPWLDSGTLKTKRIFGTTQRDLTSQTSGVAGDTYQLGETINVYDGSTTTAYTYCHDAGAVGIGDVLEVPTVFYRPNCSFYFYIDGIWDNYDSGTKTLSGENVTLNNLYKGLELDENTPRLMDDADLINMTVRVNIVYKFDKNVATNTGLDFVKSTSENLWYTFETYNGTTPYLAHYTNAWGLQSMEGRETRYTNDYLWTPVGDPYGFKMYNRYMVKNSNGSESVMTAPTLTANTNLKMAKPDGSTIPYGYEVFELLAGDADGYFRIHPVMNNSGDRLYVKRCDTDSDINGDCNNDLNYTILSTTPTDWAFGLDMTLVEPYYERAGYIGGLTTTPKTGREKSGKTLYEEAGANIMQIQKVVYDDDNIVDYADGYYRLHSVPGTPGVSPVRYASGYLHKMEVDVDGNTDESDAIPMHFYSKKGVSTTFGSSGLNNGYTVTDATRGDIPVPATEYDPSTIFYLDGGIDSNDNDDKVNPRVTMSTQGLYVKGNRIDDDHGDAVMTATAGSATKFSLIDIGGAVLLITNKLDPGTRNYLHYGQSGNKYDLKYYHNSPTNEARWCIEPADKQGLKVTTNNGGDDYYYTTFCAPFDVLLPKDDKGVLKYDAYTCDTWNDGGLNPTKVPAVDETYAAGRFVPAGTPVIIRTTDNSGNIKLALPSNSPSSAESCIFTGKYLEQLLGDGSNVYTLGLPFISNVTENASTGEIDAPVPEQAKSGVGFYINANPNKEHNASQSLWLRNNRYVLHNKIYYRGSGSGARKATRGIEFVPMIFDDEENGEEPDIEHVANGRSYPLGVYDLLGRCVATEDEVKDGSWRQRVAPGVYIVHGKKVMR
jgi:hypothetical protein